MALFYLIYYYKYKNMKGTRMDMDGTLCLIAHLQANLQLLYVYYNSHLLGTYNNINSIFNHYKEGSNMEKEAKNNNLT